MWFRYRVGAWLADPSRFRFTALTAAAAKRARAIGLAIRLACDLSGRSPQLMANATAKVKGGDLRLTATEGYADVLLGEQTKKRAKALAEAMDLGLKI